MAMLKKFDSLVYPGSYIQQQKLVLKDTLGSGF